MPLEDITAAVSKRGKTVYVMFDACRDNPSKMVSERLADMPAGAMFAGQPNVRLAVFSAQSGACPLDFATPASRNGPFAEAMARAIGAGLSDVDTLLLKVRDDVVTASKGFQKPDWYRASGAGADLFRPK